LLLVVSATMMRQHVPRRNGATVSIVCSTKNFLHRN
jgi:hypothetical protein